MKRLYVVVRNDLPPGLQLAQACHAVREFGLRFPAADVGDNLVALQADAGQLEALVSRAAQGCQVVPFYEPDLAGALTAAAFEGAARSLLRGLRLALQR